MFAMMAHWLNCCPDMAIVLDHGARDVHLLDIRMLISCLVFLDFNENALL